MKKILLSTALALALTVPAIAETTVPAASTAALVAAAPVAPVAAPAAGKAAHHKGMLTKDQWLAKIEAKRARADAAAKKLPEGVEKTLVASALARADRWVETIKGYKEETTSFARSSTRALNELGWAQAIAHYKDPYPAAKVDKMLADFEVLKAQAATLTDEDMKAAANTMIANTQSVADDLKANKETAFMSQLVHGLRKEVWALKRFLHMTTHKESAHDATKAVVAPAATTTAAPVAPAATPAPAKEAEKK